MVRQPLTERARDSLRLRALDLRDRVSGRADRLVPPRRLDFAEHSDFVEAGEQFLSHFVRLAGLQPDEAVIDVGCGVGRIARPLVGYLSARGSYDGFDSNPDGIGWCRRRYRPIPNFRFQLADLYDRRHHPHGGHAARDYAFPYEDARFDFAFTPLLTHLLEDECDRYLAELARVLKPGGRMLATAFVLDDGSRAAIAAQRSGLAFLDPDGHVAVVSEEVPEEAVAFDEGWIRGRLEAHGMKLREPVHRGTWRGDDDGVSFPDIILADRT